MISSPKILVSRLQTSQILVLSTDLSYVTQKVAIGLCVVIPAFRT